MPDIFNILSEKLGAVAKPRTILEIGVADGGDTEKIIGAVVADASDFDYFAFEPDHRNIATIRTGPLMRLPQFKLIEAAIGDGNRKATLNLSSGTSPNHPNLWTDYSFSSSLKTPKIHLQIHDWCKFETTIEVRMMRLDDVCDLYGIELIDLIWCDIQGAEDMMIAGASAALCNTHLFYSECYEEEMYEGHINADEILRRLPGEWKIAERWVSDALFENQRFA